MSSTLAYEDLHAYNAGSSFAVTNEGMEQWKELLKGISVSRAGGICSGGEIGLITLLPLVKDELVLVDHSYQSMLFAMIKHSLIQEKGPKKALDILSDKIKLRAEYERIKDKLPIKDSHPHSTYKFEEIQRFWQHKPSTLLWGVRPKLDRVKFVHGDLTDLVKYGPFELLYISNALQHNSRNGKLTINKITELVKENSFIMSSGDSFYNTYGDNTPKSWKLLASKRGGMWNQKLYQVEG